MALKHMKVYYTPRIDTYDQNGNIVTTGTNVPDYTTLLPLLSVDFIFHTVPGNLQDSTGFFYFQNGLVCDEFVYDDTHQAAVVNCYVPTGFYAYESYAISYAGHGGTEPAKIRS